MFKIVENKKIWFSISSTIIIIGILFFIFRGFNLGIDFTGGTVVQIEFDSKGYDLETVKTMVSKYDDEATITTVSSEDGKPTISIRGNKLNTDSTTSMIEDIKDKYTLAGDPSSETIGPAVGNELTKNAFISLIIATIAILIYVAIRFEYKFGIAAVIALFHDLLMTLTVYSVFNVTMNSSFIAAILTILGYSINDTIVIFDRVRENRNKLKTASKTEIADISINQTMTRSVFTVVTVLITTACVYIFVPSVRDFTFPLLIGMAVGGYSSIFIAAPVWVMLSDKMKNKSTSFAKK